MTNLGSLYILLETYTMSHRKYSGSLVVIGPFKHSSEQFSKGLERYIYLLLALTRSKVKVENWPNFGLKLVFFTL